VEVTNTMIDVVLSAKRAVALRTAASSCKQVSETASSVIVILPSSTRSSR
jgi:hypothetical protein